MVIPPGVAHACNPVVESGWNYTLALLDPEACPEVKTLFGDAPYRILPSTSRVRDSFRSLVQGGNESAGEILGALSEAGMGQAGACRIHTRSRALHRVMAHLRSQLAAPLSLAELCAVAGLSKYHLVRSFKAAYGLTPHAYLLNLRVNEAKACLRLGQELASVALDAGFCDQSHFTRVFTRCVGLTPAAYQKATAIPSKILERQRP